MLVPAGVGNLRRCPTCWRARIKAGVPAVNRSRCPSLDPTRLRSKDAIMYSTAQCGAYTVLDQHGKVLACKYGSHADDQWSVDELLQFAALRA